MRAPVDRQFDELTARSVLAGLWCAGLLLSAPALIRPDSAPFFLSMAGGVLALTAALTALQGRVAAPTIARAALLAGAAFIAFSALVAGGVGSVAYSSYAMALVGSAVLLPARTAAIVVGVTVAGGAVMAWAETEGRLPAPWITHSPWSRWAAVAAAATLVAIIHRLEFNRLHSALVSAEIELERTETAERQAARSERRYAEIVSMVPGVVYEFEVRPDRSRGFTFISDGARWLFGLTPEQVMRDADAIFRLVQPASQHVALEASIAHSYTTLAPWEIEGRIETPTGEAKWIRGHALPTRLPDGTVRWHGFLTDVTGRKEAEQALEESRSALKHSLSLLQAALESTADGLLVVDNQRRITGYNQKFLSMWRVPQALVDRGCDDELLAHVIDQLEEPGAFLTKVRELYTSPDAVSFDTLVFEDGRCFERYSQPQVVDGVTVGRVWSFRDVTARMADERRRLDLEGQLQQAQKMEALGTLAGGIAHEFNNLLTVMLGQAEIVRDEPDPARRAECLDEMAIAGARATELVRQIREFSQLQPSQRETRPAAAIVEHAIGQVQATLPDRIALSATLDEDLTMFANTVELAQVVTHLLANAVQAIGDLPGRIEVVLAEADAERIPPGVAEPRAERYAWLRVSDTGRGIAPEVIGRIFEPFFTTRRGGRGTGLGLSVVHGIVRRHGGAITVTSAPGHGTQFDVYWPAVPPPPAAPALERHGEGQTAPHGSDRHVFVVDDDESIVKVVTHNLRRMGYRVTGCTDPREATALFAKAPHAFDVVLTDLSMPEMSGLELGRRLLDLRPDVPIVLFTGNSAHFGPDEVRAHGFRALLHKPMTAATLAEVLHRAFDEEEKKGPRQPRPGVGGTKPND